MSFISTSMFAPAPAVFVRITEFPTESSA